ENTKLIQSARKINDDMPVYVVNKLLNKWPEVKTIGVFGVAYKADIDDTRTSPSELVIDELNKRNYDLYINDPYVEEYKYDLSSIDEVLENSDAIIIMVDHKQYKTKEFLHNIVDKMKTPRLLDTKNIIDKDYGIEGFEVVKLGIKS
ncbi:MAG: UDP binding domain-containing protein, partial [Acidaminobacteraceae bacterium]